MKYLLCHRQTHSFFSNSNKESFISTKSFMAAVLETHTIIDQISAFKVNIFNVLGMRNLSAFVGELFAASLIEVTNNSFKKNPHQDGYPDLLLMDATGKSLYDKLVLEGMFGPVYKVTTTKALMDSDTLAQLSIDVLLLKYEEAYCQAAKCFDYQAEIDFIVGHTPRNKFIRNLAIAQTGNTLILYNYVEKHGKPLYDLIDAKLNELPRRTRKLFFVSGGVDTDAREEIRALTEKENDAIIVASLGTFSTGINIRNLHVLIFASPSKSQIRVLQSIGRGLRKSDNGKATKVFDIADDLHWKKNRNYTLDHAAARVKLYGSEKFNFKIHEVPL